MSRLVLLLAIMLALSGAHAAATPLDDEIAPLVRRLNTSRTLGSEPVRSGRALQRFYGERRFQAVWSDGRQLLPQTDELMAALASAKAEGLNPDDYHFAPLADLTHRFRDTPTPRLAAELDLLCSDAYLTLASHYQRGRIVPARVDPDWHIPREEVDTAQLLSQAVADGNIQGSLLALLPGDPAYAALRHAWQSLDFLAVNGGWPQLELSRTLRLDSTGAEVAALRQRLAMGGDLPAEAVGGELFDFELEAAVIRFQGRHGLEADGAVGRRTLAALNVPASERARQLAVNLERRRWLPRSFGERHLLINLPAFHLSMVERGEQVLEMRVIVGRLLRQTPAFAGIMTYLVLNPYWEVPHLLAVLDHLPKIQKSRAYLDKHGFSVLAGTRRVDPEAINWQRLGEGNFPYRLRQNPGGQNALGRIKFMFPNQYAIYLHDTPAQELFKYSQRSFSSGCIRIENPLELARILLKGTPLAPAEALGEALESAFNRTVPLPSPLPVYLVYLTAWVEEDGTINFRPDLYERDSRLADALSR